MSIWNPWHGCRKLSPGCANCYVYRRDESIGKDASVIAKTGDYDLPLKKNRKGQYKLTAENGVVFTCMTSDFFLEEADDWRQGCWDMIRLRQDLKFHIMTICSTCENQDRADYRLPVFLDLPIRHREIICEPMLEEIDLSDYLTSGKIEHVTCGGESGETARRCDFRWIQEVRRACVRCGVPFTFKQTGTMFVKDGKVYHIERKLQMAQAKKSGYSYTPGTGCADAIRYQLPDRRELFHRLGASDFRSRFHLTEQDKAYVREKGLDTIYRHAWEFVEKRLSAENPANDGKQTPMKGHPVFLAQHATACCCRGCLEKWHRIPSGKVLNHAEKAYITDVLMDWIVKECQD